MEVVNNNNMREESYLSQPSYGSLPVTSIPEVLRRMATETPDDEAYIFRRHSGRDVVTFGQLEDRSMRVATGLLDLGVRPGDRVALMGPACPEWLYVDYGLMKIRALAIRLTMDLDTGDSVREILKKYRCVGLVVDAGADGAVLNKLHFLLSELAPAGGEVNSNVRPSPWLMTFAETTPDDVIMSVSGLASPPLVESDRKMVDDVTREINPEDVAVTFMTSGSCGQPKCVTFDHVSILMTLNSSALGPKRQRYFNDRAFAWLGSAPFTPLAGGITLVNAATACTVPGQQRRRVLDWMTEEEVTLATFMPYMIHDIAEEAESNQGNGTPLPASLTHVFISGERLPEDLVRRALGLLPPATLVMYASTEVGLTLIDSLHALSRNPSFGNVAPGKDIKLIDDVTGSCVPVGEIGEVCVRGRGVFQGYLDDPELTRSAKSPEGWVRTGDMARMFPGGRVQILGRRAEVISRGTRKLFPAALERVLALCPQVDKCAVIGVPDSRLYEEVCACVVPNKESHLTKEALLEYVGNQSVNTEESAFSFKHLLFLDGFPLNCNGKVDRNVLRHRALKTLKLRCN